MTTQTMQDPMRVSEQVTPKPPKVPKVPKVIGFAAKSSARQVKVGSKVALALDLLARPEGATLAEIETELSRSGAKADPRAWVTIDVRNVGYGVTTDDTGRLHLVLPEGMTAPLAHREAGATKAPEPKPQMVTEPKVKKASMRSPKKSKKASGKVAAQ